MTDFRDIMAAGDTVILSALGESINLATSDGINLGSIRGAFEDQYVVVQGVESLRPTFTTLQSLLPSDPHDCLLTYDGTTYKVIRDESDGADMTLLVLEKQ